MSSKLKILIVEDDISTQKLFDLALSDDFFEKRYSANGGEALASYKTWKPDIIILDIVMPVITGYSVLKEIREHYGDKTTTIIMATSLKHEEHIKDCVKLGIQGYMIKPFQWKKIGTKIMKYYQRDDKSVNNFIEVLTEDLRDCTSG